jgi:outer membrane protein OmpA-like peptidoglycan-associated protein
MTAQNLHKRNRNQGCPLARRANTAPMRQELRLAAAAVTIVCTFSLLPPALSAPAWPSGPAADSPQVADHPLVGRFAGSSLVGFNDEPFQEIELPLGPIEWDSRARRAVARQSEKLAGRIIRWAYQASPDRTAVEIMANLRASLAKRGWRSRFECAGATQSRTPGTCGDVFRNEIEARLARGISYGAHRNNLQSSDLPTLRYATGTVEVAGKRSHISLLVGEAQSARRPTMILVHVIEPGSLDTNQTDMSLTADDLRRSIADTGRVAVYGILFDTDRADMKPASALMLAEIAKLLKSNPGLKLFVVGHTDNQGTVAHNLELSQRRAEAVVAALRTQHGIDSGRLAARGVAQFAPVASNGAEAGRALNRRVEIVAQ